MAIWIQLPSLQLATPNSCQMVAKACGHKNESETVGSVHDLERRKDARIPLPKTTRETIIGNAPGKNKPKNSGKTWLSGNLWERRIKADFNPPWMCGVFLVPGRQKGTEWWVVSSVPLRLRESTKTGEQGIFLPASKEVLGTTYLYTMSPKKRWFRLPPCLWLLPLGYTTSPTESTKEITYPKGLRSRKEDQSE